MGSTGPPQGPERKNQRLTGDQPRHAGCTLAGSDQHRCQVQAFLPDFWV